MTSLKDLILAKTPIISVPEKMAFYAKNGDLKTVSTLTKGGSISSRNKEKVIQFVGNNNGIFKIENEGYSENNNPQKKEQRGMGAEDVNAKGFSMKEIKEQRGMEGEDINIKKIEKQRKKGVEDKYVKFTNFYKLPPFPPSGTLGQKAMYNYYKKFINAIKGNEDESIIDDRVKMRQYMSNIIKSSKL